MGNTHFGVESIQIQVTVIEIQEFKRNHWLSVLSPKETGRCVDEFANTFKMCQFKFQK